MESKRINKAVILYIVIAYVISGIGYLLWFPISHNNGAFAIIPIAGPLIAAYSTYFFGGFSNKKLGISVKKLSFTGVLVGACIPVFYIAVSILVYLIGGNQIEAFEINAKEIILMFVQWIFAGFCEEIGWRGCLFPLLKRKMKLEYACIITGILWAGWHMPLIFARDMITEQILVIGIVLFIVETISISFIMGILSETKLGESIWTYVSLHAMHNILTVVVTNAIPKQGYKFLDSGGFIIDTIIAIFAFVSWIIYKKYIKIFHS